MADQDFYKAMEAFVRSRGAELSDSPVDSVVIPTKGGGWIEVPVVFAGLERKAENG